MAFESLQGWRLPNLPRHLHQCSATLPVQKCLLSSEGPSCVSLCARGPWGCPWPCPLCSLSSGFLSPGMRCPEPALLQAGQSQLSQPLLMAEMLQSLHHLHGPVLDSVQSVPVSHTGQPSSGPSTPGLASLVGSRGKGSPPSTSCDTAPSAAQDTVLHCCRSTLLACGHPAVQRDLFSQLGSPQHVPVQVLGIFKILRSH